jgi:hypothetical protein
MICRDCKHRRLGYITCYDGQNLTEISICGENSVCNRLVDPDVERECAKYKAPEAAEVKHG